MKEATLTAAVKRELLRDGWFVFKIAGGAMQIAGMPDLLILKNGLHLWIEVKTPEGRLSGRQKWIHTVLRSYGATVHVVRSLEDLRGILCTVNSTTSTPSSETTLPTTEDSISPSVQSSTGS